MFVKFVRKPWLSLSTPATGYVPSILLAFIASFSVFILFQYLFQNELNIREKYFYMQDFDNSKSKVLLIGSSHVGVLDASQIEKIIDRGNDYRVFNLARGSDTPSKRLKELPEIIALNPKLIVYGIGYRDFGSPVSHIHPILPDPTTILKKSLFVEVDFLDNPKLTTLNVFRNMVGIKIKSNSSLISPFFPYSDDQYNVMSLSEIKNFYKNTAEEINIQSVDKNPQLKSLDLILDKFEESKIDVILYLTPHNLEYLDRLSDVDKVMCTLTGRSFDSI